MRADMTPEQVRAAGIYLNGGRRRGWKQHLAVLLDTPQTTISAWSTRSPGNTRPIPGVAAVAIKLLVAMMRQELMVTAHPDHAGQAMAQRLTALLAQPQPYALDEPPITGGGLGRASATLQRAPLLGIERPAAGQKKLAEPPPAASVRLGIEPDPAAGRPLDCA